MSGDESEDLDLTDKSDEDFSHGEENEDPNVGGDASSNVKQFAGITKKSNKEDSSSSGYKTLPSSADKPFRMSVFLWALLLGCASIPSVIIISQLCETQDSMVCEGFRKVFNSVTPTPASQYIKEQAVDNSVDEEDDSYSDYPIGPLNENEKETESSKLPWLRQPIKNARLLVDEDIKYVENKSPLYLVIIGHVFDVTSGKSYYAPGTGYFGFIGKDGSRAFVSGEFNEKGLVDDIDGLNPSDYLGLLNWIKFYFEKYTFVGYHVGRFYDASGKETAYMKKFKALVRKAETEEEADQDLRKVFPPCNIAWSADKGSRVWCTNQSGGIQRDWIGYPREFFETKKSARCACVHPNSLNDPRVRQYPNCDALSDSCVPPQK